MAMGFIRIHGMHNSNACTHYNYISIKRPWFKRFPTKCHMLSEILSWLNTLNRIKSTYLTLSHYSWNIMHSVINTEARNPIVLSINIKKTCRHLACFTDPAGLILHTKGKQSAECGCNGESGLLKLLQFKPHYLSLLQSLNSLQITAWKYI